MNLANVTKVTKMQSFVKTSGPNKIGGWDDGIIYSMYYNQHALTIELDGKNDTRLKRDKAIEAAKAYFKNRIIPYTDDQLRWHLSNNVMGLTDYTIDNIIKTCNEVNKGKKKLTDDIMIGCPIYEMLDDLKIDYNN